MTPGLKSKRRLKLADLAAEPFRLFFPAAVLVGSWVSRCGRSTLAA